MTPEFHHQEVQDMSIDTEHNGGPAAAGVRAPGSRPSPRPRAAPLAAPALVPDDTKTVTEGNSPMVSTGESEDAPGPASGQVNGVEVSSLQPTLHSPIDTLRERMRSGWGWGWAREYLTPPSVLTDAPASVAQLSGYARWGAWTRRIDGGLARNLGIVWYRLVGLPVTVLCRYTEWIAQRPGRAIPVLLLWVLFISTGPGPWIAGHLIRPVLGVVAWVLL